MTQKSAVGILGIGAYLPAQVRTNDWWPADVVAGWLEKSRRPREEKPASESADEALVRRVMAEYADDPFRGAVERRVMPEDMTAIDMEVAASKVAIENAGLKVGEIDLLLLQSTVPDYLSTNSACSVHARVGLPSTCFSLLVDGVCNGFLQQFCLAEAMIRSGRASHALLVQSSSLSRVLPYDQGYSAWFGDGATAVVVGPVSAGRGLLGTAHRTDGSLENTLVSGVPGKRWFDEGRPYYYSACPARAHQMLMGLPECARATIRAGIEQAQLTVEQVDFYASHQAFPWFRKLTQSCAGLDHARSLDTFSMAGSIIAANIPLVMSQAQEQGLLGDGDIVVAHSGGSGVTYSSLVFRWGT